MSYRYHRIGKHFVCVEQPIMRALKTLLLDYDKHQLGSIGVSRTASRKAVQYVVRGKLGLLNPAQGVDLPVFGQIAMQVHRGFKVFDFERQEVTKVFEQGVPSDAAEKEVAASKQASGIAAAPTFVAEDADGAWYKEEYICGIHAAEPGFRGVVEILDCYPDVEKCLLDLISSSQPTSVDARTHFGCQADLSFRDRWLDAGHDQEDVDEICAYVESLREWLSGQPGPGQLQLVLTHGDFSLVNAISTNTGLRFIDWEGAAPGGLYNDIFNFLFVERYYERASANFPSEMSEFIDRYRVAVQVASPELGDTSLQDLTFARRQYYLERLSLLLNRAESQNLGKVVLKSIALFRDFDQEVGDAAVQVT